MIRRLYIFYIRDIASSTTKNMMGDSELSLMVKDVDQESSAEAKSDRKMFASSQTFGSFYQNTIKKIVVLCVLGVGFLTFVVLYATEKANNNGVQDTERKYSTVVLDQYDVIPQCPIDKDGPSPFHYEVTDKPDCKFDTRNMNLGPLGFGEMSCIASSNDSTRDGRLEFSSRTTLP